MSNWLLTGEPYKVQSVALEKANDAKGFGYFMEMGLGKTAVVLAEFIDLHRRNLVDGLVVVCPHSLKKNWAYETTKWGIAEHLNIGIWPEFPEKDKTPWMHIINYEGFSGGDKRATKIVTGVCKKYRVYMVLDESIQIKNHKSVRTRALLSIARIAAYTRVLSGLPMTQGPHDLWAQLQFLNAIPGFNYYAFRNKFCKMGGFKGKQVVGARNETQLYELLDKHSFRATKLEWTDLPEKMYSEVVVDMTEEQKHVYEQMEEEFIAYVLDDMVEVDLALTKLIKLQQISCGFIYNENGELLEIPGRNPKIEAIRDIKESSIGKMLIFAHHRASIEILERELAHYDPIVLKGGMDEDELEERKRIFNEEDYPEITICQSAAFKYGHTLLGPSNNRCTNSVFFENTYNLDTRKQCEDRNHRWGQDRATNYTDLICSRTDLAASKALQGKFNIASYIIDEIRNGRIR